MIPESIKFSFHAACVLEIDPGLQDPIKVCASATSSNAFLEDLCILLVSACHLEI